jgi:hypothetical protein
MKLIKQLYKLSNTPCILALVNERDKRILLIRSSDSLVSLSRILKLIKSRNRRYVTLRKDIKRIEIRMLEGNDRIDYTYWVNRYKELGYTFYLEYKAVEYRIQVEIEDYTVYVRVKSKRGYEKTLGVFQTMEEANVFVSTYYPSQVVDRLIYGTNEASRVYFSSRMK